MRITLKRRGFTLVELLIIIVVIGVLAAMMILSSTESVTTAKAAKILANLQTLKRAATQWYLDNREKVQLDGTVKIGSTTQPIQQWQIKEDKIGLSKYISSMNDSGIKFDNTQRDNNTNNSNTNLAEGYYGLCDGGTVKEKNADGKINTIEFHRNAWYVGYRFKAGEEKVRDKIRGRMQSAGVFLGTADAHKDTYNDNSVAVWMKVL